MEILSPHWIVLKGKIPNLFSNYLRLKPLSQEAAHVAVWEPLKIVNYALPSGEDHFDFEHGLVNEIIKQVPAGHSLLTENDKKRPPESEGTSDGIETPYLQLVLTSLWNDKQAQQTRKISWDIYSRLGKAEGIVKSHLDNVMLNLSISQRTIAAKLLQYLITSNGTKIALNVGDLQRYTNLATKKIEPVLKALSNQKERILNSLQDGRYELFHDALAPAVLHWQDRYLRRRKILRTSGFVIFACVGFFGSFALYSWMVAKDAQLAAVQLEREAVKLKAGAQEAKLKKLQHEKEMRQAELLLATGRKKRFQKDLTGSSSLLKQAYDSFTLLGSDAGMAKTLIEIGMTHARRNRYSEGQKALQEALAISKKIKDDQLSGQALEQLASLEERKENTKEALQYYAQAEEAYEKAKSFLDRARILERQAVNYEEAQDLRQSLNTYKKALSNYDAAGNQIGIIRVRSNIQRIESLINPWGFLINLHVSGKSHELKGDEFRVGRNVKSVKLLNDVSFSNNVVSRRHLAIYRDRVAEDLRSLNGTTINGNFLRYGDLRPLSDGDIISLAHYRVLQFKVQRPEPLDVPVDAWGILIDNPSKTYHYLRKNEYSLGYVNNKLDLKEGITNQGLLKIRMNGQIEIYDMEDEWFIRFTYKDGDYKYKTHLLKKSGTWIVNPGLPGQYFKLNQTLDKVEKDGPLFQIISR